MAAFSDYLDLRFAVSDHVGNRAISDVMPRLVQMAETQLNQRLRTVWQVTDATLTFAEGSAPLPTDFLEMLHVYGHCRQELRSGLPGVRGGYSIGPAAISIHGFSGDRDIQYYAKLPTLTASASASNWLLERNGDVYLYAVGLQAAKHLKDVDLAQATDQLLSFALQAVKIEDERMRWSNSVVRVGGMTP